MNDLVYPKGYEPVREGRVRHGDIFLNAERFDRDNEVQWIATDADDWGQLVSDFELVLRAPMMQECV